MHFLCQASCWVLHQHHADSHVLCAPLGLWLLLLLLLLLQWTLHRGEALAKVPLRLQGHVGSSGPHGLPPCVAPGSP
jgi:hypothetical protein